MIREFWNRKMPSAGDDGFLSDERKLAGRKAQFGVQISTDNRDVAAFADILFVAVKPQFMPKC